LEQKLLEGKEGYQQLIAQGNVTKQKLEELTTKAALAHNDDDPSCPLCEQNLSTSRKRFLKSKFTQQKKDLISLIEQLTTDIKKLKATLIEQHTVIKKQKSAREHNTKIKLQITELKKTVVAAIDEISTITKHQEHEQKQQKQIKEKQITAQQELKKHIAAGKKELTNNPLCITTLAIIHKNEIALKQLSYDTNEHAQATKKLQKNEINLAAYAKLREQTMLQDERQKQITQLSTALEQLNNQKKVLQKDYAHYKELEKQEALVQERETTINTAANKLTKQKETLLLQKGALESRQKKLKQIEQEYQTQCKLINELTQQADDYHEIAAATSKNGIQALLIENAIPEIEQEANYLLGKLTNNQAQLFIESLRDLKKGGTKETLDIKISDSAGIRPYELFSGGEAFRIDFALRIAISKLLARRAGTSLQTLIIDEGFGSQDEEGLAQIMDAIYKIQDDFLKIIIVSHLTSMKDQFPVHFVIEKDAQGSHVHVIELG